MNTLTRLVTSRPWLTIAITLAISIFFGAELRHVRVNNDVKDFLPELQTDRQQYFRSVETFGGEFVAIIALQNDPHGSHADVFNPVALQDVQELTDWLEGLEIDTEGEYGVWVKPDETAPIVAARNKHKRCTPEQLEKIEQAEVPADLDGYVKVWVCKAPRRAALDNVVSLANIKAIYDEEAPAVEAGGEPEHKLMIENLWADVPQTQAEADLVRQRATSWEMYSNNVISPPDAKTGLVANTAIYAFMPDGVSIDFSQKLQHLIDEKIAELDRPDDGVIFRSGGMPMVSVWLGRYLQSDLRRLIPFVFAVILLVLILSFRNPLGVAMPFVTVTLGTLWTVGLTGWLGKPLTLITSAIPTLITAVGSAYTIHLIHHYLASRRAGVESRQAVSDMMREVGLAVVMAGLTTIGGFFSLMTSSVVPIKDFGMLASFGTFASLAISMTLVPALLVALRQRGGAKGAADQTDEPAKGWLGGALRALATFVTGHKRLVGGATIAVIVASAFLSSRVEVTSNLVEYFKDDSEIRAVDDYLRENFGGTNIFYVTFDGGEADFWKNPAELQKLDDLTAFIHQRFGSTIGKTMSVTDYMKKMWMAFDNDRPEGYRIPPTRQGVSDMLFMLSQESDALESVVDFDYQRVRLSVKVTNGQTMMMGELRKEIDGWVQANWPEMAGQPAPKPSFFRRALAMTGFIQPDPQRVDVRYRFSGENYLRYRVDRLIVVGQMQSIAMSVIVVWLLAMIVFRSIVGGLLSVVPTVMAVLCNFAIMGAFHIALDVGTALIAAAAVGMGIDYAIHYINRYRLARQEGHDQVEAVVFTHLTSGKAIVFNTLAVALGFFVLIFSNFNPVTRMGLLTGITMIVAGGISLTMLPMLLAWLRPQFIRRVAKNGDNE